MEILNEIFITGLVLLSLKPAGVLPWISVRAGASILENAGSLMPRFSKQQHSLQRNTVGLMSV